MLCFLPDTLIRSKLKWVQEKQYNNNASLRRIDLISQYGLVDKNKTNEQSVVASKKNFYVKWVLIDVSCTRTMDAGWLFICCALH